MDVTSGQTLTYASPTSGSKFGTFTTTLSLRSTVGAALLAIALFIFIRKRRKQHQQSAPEADSTQVRQNQQFELHGQDLAHELDRANMVTELPTEHVRYELEGRGEEKKE